MFSDDVLVDYFVLKGGNALNLVHRLEGRTSVDIDLSIPADFDDPADVEARIFAALDEGFDQVGLVVIDKKFSQRPKIIHPDQDPDWGGYMVEFKLVERAKHDALALGNDLQVIRGASLEIGPSKERTFSVDISKHEFCEGKMPAQLGDSVIYVYTLPMLAIEKFRAICQQLPEYPLRRFKVPRARDFYDICRIVEDRGVDLTTEENRRLFRLIFEAKRVPLAFLSRVGEQREFHRADWESVENSAVGELREFDYYFDFAVEMIKRLQAAGIE